MAPDPARGEQLPGQRPAHAPGLRPRLLLARPRQRRANVSLQQLDAPMGEAIAETCLQLLREDFMQHFPVDVFQTGSGTSSNMNANEVVATLASRRLGGKVNRTTM